LQHAPVVGCGHGFGEHAAATFQAFPASHPACPVTTAHAPVAALQHVSDHVNSPVPDGHSASVVLEHPPPMLLQHCPIGCGQGFGEHAAPSVNMPEAHSVWSAAAQSPPAALQQAPGVPTWNVAVVMMNGFVTVAVCRPHWALENRNSEKACALALRTVTVTRLPVKFDTV
jgi:hypothetical protein